MNLYVILGLPIDASNASPAAIKRAYRTMAMRYHHDRNPGDEKAREHFKLVQMAYEVLSDPDRRKRYDETGEYDLRADNAKNPIYMLLADVMAEVVNEALEKGGDLARLDVVMLMRNVLGQRREELSQALLMIQKGKDAMGRIKGRFSTSDGAENDLQSIAKMHLAMSEKKLQEIEMLLRRIKEAQDVLKRYHFSREGLSVFTGAPAWVTTTLH